MKLRRVLVSSLLCWTACLSVADDQRQPDFSRTEEQDSGKTIDAQQKSSPSAGNNVGTALKFTGQTWSVADETLFDSRFEKFLSTPEENGEQETAHRKILNEIVALLDPTKLTAQSLSASYRLLTRAAGFPGDSRLCDTLSGSIYGIWQSRRNQTQLAEANKILEEERSRSLQNTKVSAGAEQSAFNAKRSSAQNSKKDSNPSTQALRGVPRDDNAAAIKANFAKGELSELQAKIQYQGLIVQLFLQRRFHHVLIGTRFYQALFPDGDSKLNLPESIQNPFPKTAGSQNASVLNIEALANESIKEVQAGMMAFSKHYGQNELTAATKRLRESLILGEFMPELRTLPFVQKKKVLQFLQNSSRLREALEAKDYASALGLISGEGGLAQTTQDFDAAPSLSRVETATNSAQLHLAKARSAANSGNRDAFESELKLAASIWPTNPELTEISGSAFLSADVLSTARSELDRLLSQKSYRLIAAQSVRFLAAAHGLPGDRPSEVRAAIDKVKGLESSLRIAEEMDSGGDSAGAWETVELLAQSFPEDPELNQARARYTPKAADFIRFIQEARNHEAIAQHATSLAWLLNAQRLYPRSAIAAESINRNLAKLFP